MAYSTELMFLSSVLPEQNNASCGGSGAEFHIKSRQRQASVGWLRPRVG